MSITKELRHNIEGAEQLYGRELTSLTAIADRIDAEHERECKEQYACGVEHGIGVSIDASMIQTHGYVELPKDADNVPWNVGDRDEDGNVVITLKLASSGWYVITDGDWPYRPESKRHYHTLTVEDVLREFANGWDLAEGIGKADIYIKNFAAKLRLKED